MTTGLPIFSEGIYLSSNITCKSHFNSMKKQHELDESTFISNGYLKYIRVNDIYQLHIKESNSLEWIVFFRHPLYKLAKKDELKKYNTHFDDLSGLLLLQYVNNNPNLKYELLMSDEA